MSIFNIYNKSSTVKNLEYLPQHYRTNLGKKIFRETFWTGDFSSNNWSLSGDVNWTVTNTEMDAFATSGNISDNESSILSTTITITKMCLIKFYIDVSSEDYYDYLSFYINDILQDQWSGEYSGYVIFTIFPGENIELKWVYSKNGYSYYYGGRDNALLKDISIYESTSSFLWEPKDFINLELYALQTKEGQLISHWGVVKNNNINIGLNKGLVYDTKVTNSGIVGRISKYVGNAKELKLFQDSLNGSNGLSHYFDFNVRNSMFKGEETSKSYNSILNIININDPIIGVKNLIDQGQISGRDLLLHQDNIDYRPLKSVKGITFDGVNDHLLSYFYSTPSMCLYPSESNSWSICFYVKTNTSEGGTVISDCNDYENVYFQFKIQTNGTLDIIIKNNVNNISNINVNDNNYHHYVITWNGINVKLYIDGIYNSNLSKGESVYTSTDIICVGALDYNTPQDFFKGNIDNIMYFHRTLNIEDIKYIYQNYLNIV